MRVLALVTVAGCAFTRAPDLDERPRWKLDHDATFASDCVDARAFVRKSGKQGFGVAIKLVSHHDCHVRISGTWHLAGASTAIAPIELDMRGRSLRYGWLPVAFDNNAAWNDGDVDGQLVLAVETGVPAPAWTIDLHDDWSVPP
jgi:hypothetical protein